MNVSDAKKELSKIKLNFEIVGNGEFIYQQFPMEGEKINLNSKVILYVKD